MNSIMGFKFAEHNENPKNNLNKNKNDLQQMFACKQNPSHESLSELKTRSI